MTRELVCWSPSPQPRQPCPRANVPSCFPVTRTPLLAGWAPSAHRDAVISPTSASSLPSPSRSGPGSVPPPDPSAHPVSNPLNFYSLIRQNCLSRPHVASCSGNLLELSLSTCLPELIINLLLENLLHLTSRTPSSLVFLLN